MTTLEDSYWRWQGAPGRTASVVEAAAVSFEPVEAD